MYRVLTGILAILISAAAFAVNSEYKNTLTKIELNKTSDSSYNINLYTTNTFNEPVKVIKKSDLNYYILLPETKNNTQNLSSGNSDIKSIESRLYPYAGADVHNGYTKINISTAKPISFSVSTKTTVALNRQKPMTEEAKKEEVKTAVGETKVQKKNLVQEVQKPNDNTLSSAGTKTKLKEAKTVQKNNTTPSKKAEKPANATAKADAKDKTVKKQLDKVVKEVKETKTAAKPQKQTVDIQKSKAVTQAAELPQEPEEQQPAVENTTEENAADENIQSNKTEETPKADTNDTQEQVEQDDTIPVTASVFAQFKKKVQTKLSEYGLNIRELLLMSLAAILSFVIVLLILTKNRDTDTRLKSKADFADKSQKPKSSLVAKKDMQNQKPANECFVFENNIRQTGFIPPASSNNKTYELSKYNPVKENHTGKIEPYRSKKVTSEYDIIQNILKDDNYIDLSGASINLDGEKTDFYQDKEPQPVYQEPEKEAAPEQTEPKSKNSAPEVLSSVEIAPQRGFMCVLYNNTINFMGYIFEDVFALYDFKQAKLDNYSIKFRLSEKTPNGGANFLVKVGKSKMLVNVTKSSMNLELAM